MNFAILLHIISRVPAHLLWTQANRLLLHWGSAMKNFNILALAE